MQVHAEGVNEDTPSASSERISAQDQISNTTEQKTSPSKRPVLIPIVNNGNKPPRIPLVSGFVGEIQVNNLPDLIQFLALSSATTLLKINSTKNKGLIWFSRGIVVHASCKELQGHDAFYQILTWKKGYFSMEKYTSIPLKTIDLSVSVLLLKAFHRIDESNKQVKARRSTAKLEIAREQASEPLAEPSAVHQDSEPTSSVEPTESCEFFFDAAISQITDITGYLNIFLVKVDQFQVLNFCSTDPQSLDPLARNCAEIVSIYREIEQGSDDMLEEVVFTLPEQIHILRATRDAQIFIYLSVDRSRITLGEAKILLKDAENRLYKNEEHNLI